MQLEGTRFGNIEFDDGRVVEFPAGLIGFSDAKRFVLLEPGEGRAVAWLQSVQTPALAFPVVSAERVAADYPTQDPRELARGAGLPSSDVAVLVVLATRTVEPRLVANLLAPLVIDVASGKGAQVVLDHRKYSATTPLVARD